MISHNYYTRITIHKAKKLWREDKEICLHPCKLRISEMFQPCLVSAEKYLKDIEWKPVSISDLLHATIELQNDDILYQKAWDIMYNNWAYYNTNYEMGYYAHYYIKE